MSKTDTDTSPAAPDAAVRRRSPPEQDEPSASAEEPVVGSAQAEQARSGEPTSVEYLADDEDPVFLSQTVRRMGRRRTRILALLSLLLAVAATVVMVDAFLAPEPASPIEQATGGAWNAVAELSDGLRDLRPGGDLASLREEAGSARDAVQAARDRMKTLEVPISQTPLRGRVVSALRADDDWIGAVDSTLANPRSRRRADLARLAKRAAVATSLVGDDVEGARGSVGGTGRLLSATRRGGG